MRSASKVELARRRRAGEPGEEEAAAEIAGVADIGGGGGDARALRHEAHVAGKRDAQPSARRRSVDRGDGRLGPEYAATAAPTYHNWRTVSIYGGSTEVQKNIMAKMVLGL